jgi:hypothetical protein
MNAEPIALPPSPPTNMLGKTVGINFFILLILVLASLMFSKEEAVIMMAFGIVALTGFNFFIGIILLLTPKWMQIGKAMMIAAFVVLLIGLGLFLIRTGSL